ncbi:bifunctional adenosylcobinamide kinase/adenosylcobinamide-phosphate guanylyltransferase [Ohtaekwangia koreensis]|uniref:Adenosylcobinamide kinase n=1 Tax=Ohtaekwangia koreensis TaxID=688867 RepID=A0A1T5IR32_9BACT|nr:bifunctional adenosylcobinamide kinase/adenosylcobinamide-phosphate guanylyltransferase [Ohtaekwangia koreensis]SKC41542.1 adenosylcobinamide kinase /adenosylcobinamide-phosphate guanylyltransferase [Ohtaekwangia koreensis]
MIILVTGGARSGKSRYAQERAKQATEQPVYVATARVWDEDFKSRIRRHQQERGPEWTNYEAEKYISTLPLDGSVVVIDCVTLWLTNFFVDHQQDIEAALVEFKNEIDKVAAQAATFIIITNEIGMGLHADTEVGRKFVDLQGWANQYIASQAEEVIFMVSGIPVRIKPATH